MRPGSNEMEKTACWQRKQLMNLKQLLRKKITVINRTEIQIMGEHRNFPKSSGEIEIEIINLLEKIKHG